MEHLFKNIDLSTVYEMGGLIGYSEGAVQSRTIVKEEKVNISIFSFAKGEGLSTHKTNGDALVYILDGLAGIKIGDEDMHQVGKGEMIIMPKDIPHSVEAIENFKMLLVIVK
ncbi:MAG: Cupin 2 conserved barrel domain protein [Bacillales bacterium]|jgi:quercetin dioxygenase-like cupin family protein|nr:Cupin 2 conserved barrel domain protein [Bacillales bacterium]